MPPNFNYHQIDGTEVAASDISKVLTPEQRAKIGERMKARGAMMQERMERLQRERPKQ